MSPKSLQSTAASLLRGYACKRQTILMLLLAVSCLQAQSRAQVSISGPTELRLGSTAQYSVLAGGSPVPAAVWSVNGFAGGDNATGLISASGLYSPALTIWAGHSVKISATIASNPASSATLSVRLLNPLPVFTSGSISQTTSGSSFLLDVRGSSFVPASQLLASGADVATDYVSSGELQSTITLPAGTTSVNVGVLNPDAEQNSPVSRTLPVTVPTLTVSPASIAFGNVSINTTDTQPVTLASTGTVPVTVNSGVVSGTGFTLSPATFPVTLNPGLAITLDVRFDPTVPGSSTGQLTVQSNSSTNSTAVTSLSGAGESHQVTLSWEAPANSSVPVAGYKSYRASSGSTTFQLLNSSLDTETTYVDSTVQSGLTYTYYVTSVSSAGVESTPSNQVEATIP